MAKIIKNNNMLITKCKQNATSSQSYSNEQPLSKSQPLYIFKTERDTKEASAKGENIKSFFDPNKENQKNIFQEPEKELCPEQRET